MPSNETYKQKVFTKRNTAIRNKQTAHNQGLQRLQPAPTARGRRPAVGRGRHRRGRIITTIMNDNNNDNHNDNNHSNDTNNNDNDNNDTNNDNNIDNTNDNNDNDNDNNANNNMNNMINMNTMKY